eukprot:1002051-Prorocentrum_minimum.AAC.1
MRKCWGRVDFSGGFRSTCSAGSGRARPAAIDASPAPSVRTAPLEERAHRRRASKLSVTLNK